MAMRATCLFLLFLPAGLLAQGQYDLDPLPPFPDHVQYNHYGDQIDNADNYYDYQEVSPRPPEEQFQSQQQVPQEVIPAPTPEPPVPGDLETEPTEPGPLDCREEQYPCTRLYSIHKPCKQCLNEVCFYSLRRVYVVNKEICVRTVCAHEELLRADLCRDKFSKCGVMAVSGLCQSVAASCARSCGGC
ncbi:microfibrillar-associated protein 2 isoform X4 [Microtus pennsylvanicus]|uniref:Microfibrillar-associated protein 2 isoform X3 n=1 Tax=Microtus ochrogaster TaxID=79684 RepID=A0ABM0KUA7_MICOH|nr:microfibrillar-associated protein 2 isoform X3 [Microtus ochrogaster]XP_048282638.1 microfibrillar-associated protein 2 isoform X1 [Myodes glareolus]